MREIIFRGKRRYNGEWVYGWPFADTADCSLKKAGKCGCPHDGSEYFIVEWVDDYHEYEERQVIPNTVGQYTGIKDDNGKKIFEGDILLLDDIKGIVNYGTGCFCVKLPSPDYLYRNNPAIDMVLNEYPGLEIIGNAHDNPELIYKE